MEGPADTHWRRHAPQCLHLKSIRVIPQLHGLVSRRRYGELPERELQGRKLQRSLLDVRFHIRDLVGMGMLERVQTTSGVILRAPKHKS